MNKFIPRIKLSKKARRELDKKKRITWNGVNPVTKKVESKKKYNRKKTWEGFKDSSPKFFLFNRPVAPASTVAIAMALLIFLTGCAAGSTEKNSPFTRAPALSSEIPAQGLVPHNYTLSPSIASPIEKKEYTLLVYMNGSDLETEYGAAADDLVEMAESGYNGEDINLLIFTGGAKRWHFDFIPNKTNAIFQMENGEMIKLAEAGKDSMGAPEVLAGFINFGKNYFPAEKYGLIMWNHGGGAIVGYGMDERYEENPEKAMMKLKDIDRALEASAPGEGFQLIGFDTCLMATLEMAGIATKYGEYMVASEELEPGGGWDYSFLGEIKAGDTGAEIGKAVVDYYRNCYENSEEEDIATLSLTDLRKIEPAYEAFEVLALAAGSALAEGQYNLISKARASSRAFGGGQEDETDMIDVLQLAQSLEEMFPWEARRLVQALNDAVIYKYDNYYDELGGLSVYFPFANRENMAYYVEVYNSMGQLPNYSSFIRDFSVILAEGVGGDQFSQWTEADGLVLSEEQSENLSEISLSTWTEAETLGFSNEEDYIIKLYEGGKLSLDERNRIKIQLDETPVRLNGQIICAYEIARNGERIRYKIPVRLNGDEAYLLAVYGGDSPEGEIIGAVPVEQDIFNMLDKKMVSIGEGDIITPRYRAAKKERLKAGPTEWLEGNSFAVGKEIRLETEKPNPVATQYMINLTDVWKNDNYLPVELE